MTFDELGLSAPLLRALEEQGYREPTPIQVAAIPAVLSGRDLMAAAQTGTGKTAGFTLPILQRLHETGAPHPHRIRVLVLTPTRELAAQVAESVATYGAHLPFKSTVVFGGVKINPQIAALRKGVDILVATPGRLLDLLEQQLVNLSGVSIFVLDEADRMLDMGFIKPIQRIASELLKPPARQTLLFSATMVPEIRRLAESLMHQPVSVAVSQVASTAPLIKQAVYMVPRAKKPSLLRHLLGDRSVSRALVFTRTKHGADRLSRALNQVGVGADSIHGNKAQNQRRRALESFRNGTARVLVATDVAARGLDVDGITHVVNYDMPLDPDAYVHRIGRTGRAGATGIAVSFCDSDEQHLLRDIERLIGKRVPAIRDLPALPDVAVPAQSETNRGERGSVGHRGHRVAKPGRRPARSSRESVHSGRRR